ncbi:hypothetical protein KC571_01365 [candidate division WWE3 bacterium]|uniref:Uncharacterized protein n=1 Tax=candidate division WWE3 bacterium TaxID=2053526 RepID=A0A955RQ17_UNCKA|nr:hypothetical protein [candidate division WWE3 bacterium]
MSQPANERPTHNETQTLSNTHAEITASPNEAWTPNGLAQRLESCGLSEPLAQEVTTSVLDSASRYERFSGLNPKGREFRQLLESEVAVRAAVSGEVSTFLSSAVSQEDWQDDPKTIEVRTTSGRRSNFTESAEMVADRLLKKRSAKTEWDKENPDMESAIHSSINISIQRRAGQQLLDWSRKVEIEQAASDLMRDWLLHDQDLVSVPGEHRDRIYYNNVAEAAVAMVTADRKYEAQRTESILNLAEAGLWEELQKSDADLAGIYQNLIVGYQSGKGNVIKLGEPQTPTKTPGEFWANVKKGLADKGIAEITFDDRTGDVYVFNQKMNVGSAMSRATLARALLQKGPINLH